MKVWNLENGLLEYHVPDPGEKGLFRQSGAIVSLSQSEDIVASAYSNMTIGLFSSENCQTSLDLITLIKIENYVEKHAFIRNIYICDGQIYVCNVSGKNGILCFSIWE